MSAAVLELTLEVAFKLIPPPTRTTMFVLNGRTSSLALVLALVASKQVVAHLGPDRIDEQFIFRQSTHSCKETAPCVLTPEETEGPYYIADEAFRSNLTEDRLGVPMHLEFTVVDVETCGPLSKAFVDVWTCDAAGVYSGFSNLGGLPGSPGGPPGRGGGGHGPPGKGKPPGGPGGPGGQGPPQTNNNTFLRGVQETDSDGKVAFDLIFPGWYQGRTTHIHVKIHSPTSPLATLHTGQVYFEEAITAEIAALSPYSSNKAVRKTNEQDGIYRNEGGEYALLKDTAWVVGEGGEMSVVSRGWMGVNGSATH